MRGRVSNPKWAYHPGSPSRTTDGSPPLVGRDEHGGDERRADALALVVGAHRDRARGATERPLPHRRAAAHDVADDLAVQLGDEGQGVEHVAVGAQPVEDAGLERSARRRRARRTPRRAGPGSAPRRPGSSRRRTRAGFTGSSSSGRSCARASEYSAYSKRAALALDRERPSSSTSSPSLGHLAQRHEQRRAPGARTTRRARRRARSAARAAASPEARTGPRWRRARGSPGRCRRRAARRPTGRRGRARPGGRRRRRRRASEHRSPSMPASSGDQAAARPARRAAPRARRRRRAAPAGRRAPPGS